MTANMYRVGDYVYFETSSTSPYQIRRIEELNKTASGNVEAKVMCFYRRRDLPSPLIQLADKHQCALDESAGIQQSTADQTDLSGKQRHQMRHRELFLSRQVETLPATHIRGKCSVTLFNETESLQSYLNKDDMFFYCLVFDPTQKTLLADKGEIRVGSRYQSDISNLLKEGENDNRELNELETLIWTPEHELSDRQIDQFLVVSRSVGTFARALDCSSSVKQPSLHMSAAAASRDITLFHAMDTLHKHEYNLSTALSSLVPSSGPVLCRDEMEEWSASEANLFEEALDKYGKDFNDIRQDFLPWKTLKNIVEYYYMWKTTDRYVQQKRVKAVEAESKLKQVYIPNYNKSSNSVISHNNNKNSNSGSGGNSISINVNGSNNNNSNGNSTSIDTNSSLVNATNAGGVSLGGKACESCNVTVSSQWYAWGPSHMQCRLCQMCWSYWKRYGGLKVPTKFSEGDFDGKKRSGSDLDEDKSSSSSFSHRHRCNIGGCGKEFKLKAHLGRHYATSHGIVVRSGSPRPVMKTRTAFYLFTTPLTRISRKLCKQIMRPRHASRAPFFAINIQAVKQECAIQMAGKTLPQLKQLLVYNKKNRGSVTSIANKLGNPGNLTPQWLILTKKEDLPQPDVVAFPKPPKAPDGSLMYERVPNKPEAEKIPLNSLSPSLKRRAYDDLNGGGGGGDSPTLSGPPPKRLHKEIGLLTKPSEQYATCPPSTNLISSSSSSTSLHPHSHHHHSHSSSHLPRHISHINGKAKIAHMTRTGSGRKQLISWMDAPEDVYFRATEQSKRERKQITTTELRRAARKPWRILKNKNEITAPVVILD